MHHLPTLTTERLILRPLELSDSEAIQNLFPHWEIVKFLTTAVPWPYPPDGAFSFIRDRALPDMEQKRAWHWSLRPKANPDTLIGVASLRDSPEDNRGFWIAQEWQRQGLMTEASDEIARYWFEVLQRPTLRIPKAAVNAGSRRISEKAGMRVIRSEERNYVSGRYLTEIWEITAEEWRALTPAR